MTRETKSQLIAARTRERERLLKLVERFENDHVYWRAVELEERAANRLATEQWASIRKDIYAEVVLALRAALRLEPQPSAAKPGSEP